ncbi:hypothetical protein WME76_02315 [Sorangium sp. So ce119]|uniref:hypothetical protein n=1 Tax=Sorangium sp. So ce119 TaxID=3133279 RepID=UPI003F5DD390
MITDLGSLTLGAVVPAAGAAAAATVAACDVAAPDVSGQLTALATFAPSASLGLAAQLELAQSIVANILASIALGIEPPSLAVQASAAAAVISTLEAKLATVEAQLELAVELQALLGTAGVRLLRFAGPQNTLGGELSSALGSATTSANALVLLTTSGVAWSAMQGVFKTS